MERMQSAHQDQNSEPIAIIGSGCRFPGGSNSASALWELLKNPRDVLSEIPPSRFNVRGFYHEDSQFPGHANVKHSYLLGENIAHFDAPFFSITPTEAMAMDPQQRILLETVYEAMESSGMTIEGLKGSQTGVYVGQMYGDYESLQYRDLQSLPTYHGLGVARSIVSNRVSYFFDWHGPSMTVDTACSSSLVAVHLAVQALRAGDINVAVAAGTNILLGPEPYIYESKLKMLSPEGRSRMWDKDANGYARGDGVAAIMLKKLSAALADGDHIHCVIRETGVNQDGRSRGITMPSAAAQAALIASTYKRAGLDLSRESDRCQYFEAHGTGTPAGDPVEAEAVHTAFFGHKADDETAGQKLLVGSIKTIIGHTESTAGIAGIMKVALALKHGKIPPNLLLNNLNPNVLPFYKYLEIPQQLTPWPTLPSGQCRRASVNSFGFGGTNAHIILESHESQPARCEEQPEEMPLTPFVFSAQSKPSLIANLNAHVDFLEQHKDVDLRDFARSLQTRRSVLPLRVHFSSSSAEELLSAMRKATNNLIIDPKSSSGGDGNGPQLLGIFTGQGAQWPCMGAELVHKSAYASEILFNLDEVLTSLPEDDRPTWSLREELFLEASSSNVGQATVSQPICTAVQIILVELLRKAGIRFSAVVGHSSGEIAAAFAAGYLSSQDAIRIAYYRGFHSHLAGGPKGVSGAMLAVGTTAEDAEELCSDEEFQGRLNVAACNSPTSVTLSGDADAIAEIADIFEDESKFVRRLRVDTAYHSHHMRPCSEPYLASIKNITVRTQDSQFPCAWFSSVYPDRSPKDMASITPSYWVDNLLSPVLFTQALECAASSMSFQAAVEVGPHPALKGPVRETLQARQMHIPYTGTLERQKNSIINLSDALGYVWSHVDNMPIDFGNYDESFGGRKKAQFVPDMPLYRWNHTQEYWNESEYSRNLRQRSQKPHVLLGDLTPYSSSHQLSWKHVVRPKDVPWVHGHRIQGQTVFPAAAYVATALETAPFLVAGQDIQLIEVENLTIHQAMIFENDDNDSGIEVRVTIASIDRTDPDSVTAKFTYESCTTANSPFHLVADGKLVVRLGQPSQNILQSIRTVDPNLINVPRETFYSSLAEIGYEYADNFKALSNLRRKLGTVTGSVAAVLLESNSQPLAVHPAVLDAAFHSILLAHSYPSDGQLWSLHLPTHIDRVRVNPRLCGTELTVKGEVSFEASIPSGERQDEKLGFAGDVEIHSSSGDHCAIQVERLHVVPFTPATALDDEQRFYASRWIDAEPDAAHSGTCIPTTDERKLAEVLERGSFYYLRHLESQVPADCPGRSDKYFDAYLKFASHTLNQCSNGTHQYAKREWLQDTEQDIIMLAESFSERPEVKAMFAVGHNMPRAIRGETTMLEHLIMNGILEDYYARALSMAQMTPILAETVAQVTKRFPHAKILEVGAGTGGATREILRRVSGDFQTYVFTDISAGFFENAQSEFASFESRMTYSVLDLEGDVKAQGFEKGTFDVVVASLVIHATKSLDETLRRIRYLLKPGGYLIACEVTDSEVIRVNSLFGCLPGWWQGLDDGRCLGAAVNDSKWDLLLRTTGFSGIDSISTTQDSMAFPTSVFVSQAVDDWVEFIREPLIAEPIFSVGRALIKKLFIVGGSTLQISRLVQTIQNLVRPFCDDIVCAKSLVDLDHGSVTRDSTVLVLEDLENSVFKELTEKKFESLKKLFGSEKNLVWVTQDRRINNPYASMPIGFARSALWEVPELHLQFVDLEEIPRKDPRVLVESLLRFQVVVSAQQQQSQPNSLFSIESEVVISGNSRQQIQRMLPVVDANDRYNSARRAISKEVTLGQSEIEVSRVDDAYIIKQVPLLQHTLAGIETQIVTLRVTYSTLRAVRTNFGDFYIAIGKCTSSGEQYLALSDSASSLLTLPKEAVHPLPSLPTGAEARLLRTLAAQITVEHILKSCQNAKTVIIHNAPVELEMQLREHSNATVNMNFTTTSETDAQVNGRIYISQFSRKSLIKELLPRDASACIDFTLPEHQLKASVLDACFRSANVAMVGVGAVFPVATFGNFPMATDTSIIMKSVSIFLSKAMTTISTPTDAGAHPGQMNIGNIDKTSSILDALTVIEWTEKSVHAMIQPVQSSLRADRSYWLVGLSGSMGLSLADWMIDHGAVHLIISSRNPNVDKAWLDAAARRGAMVRVLKNDVTNLESLRATYEEIRQTMPALAGVAQGAMVLRDGPLRDMDLEDMTDVLRPKVNGSLNLELLLQDEVLDFFVFFSSLATVAGNVGQTNYTTANMFMSGLAQQRRHRGAAASVIDIGPVLGTGIITRELGDDVGAALAERGLIGISETDVHQLFAEAINSSHPESKAEWQIATAFRKLPSTATNRPMWYNYPQFACFTQLEVTHGANNSGQQGGVSIKDQLADAKSLDEVQAIIANSFTRELRKMLRLSDDFEIITTLRTDELGLDSLVAVRIRSWFLNNFQVNIPALRILMGASLQDLILQAQEGIPPELIPKLSSNSDEREDSEESENVSAVGSSPSASVQLDTPMTTEPQTQAASVEGEPLMPLALDEVSVERSGQVSFTQSVFLFVHELLEDKSTLNNAGMIHLKGEIRVADLSDAVNAMGARHEALRTRIRVADNEVVQEVVHNSSLALEHKRINSIDELAKEYASLRTFTFDLEHGNTSRVVLLSRAPDDHFLLIVSHHIIFDRTSTGIFLQDLEILYHGGNVPPPLQYLDYSTTQREEYVSGKLQPNIRFWCDEFSTFPETLPLHRSRMSERRPLERYASRVIDFRINNENAERVRQLARSQKSTPFHVCLAAFGVLLHRFLGVDDVCIGIADSCRRDEHMMTSVGPFLNMLPARLSIPGDKTIDECISDARQKALGVLGHAMPFEAILNELQVVREASHTPLAQAFLNYAENNTEESNSLLGCQMTVMREDQAELPYDVAFTVVNNTGRDMRIVMNVQESLYTEEDAIIIANGFEDILSEFSQDPSLPVGDQWNFRGQLLRTALSAGQGPSFGWDSKKTLVHKFYDICANYSSNTAVQDSQGNSLTYEGLTNRIASLLARLVQQGVRSGHNIAVFQKPTIDWVVSVLAILQIGAVYVPFDVATPLKRLSIMCRDCQPACVLVNKGTVDLAQDLECPESTAIIDVSLALDLESNGSFGISSIPEESAMMLYTSGSTGTPKAVILPHSALVHEFEHCIGVYKLNEDDVVLQQSAWGFDLSITQLFLALCVGAKLHVACHTMRSDPEAIVQTIASHGITTTYATPTEYRSWLSKDIEQLLRGSSWNLGLVAGEPVTQSLLRLFKELKRETLRLFNVYGPTETTCGSTKMQLHYQTPGIYDKSTIPVGKASANESFYILDTKQNLQPVGQVGEVVIGGVGVASGYYHDDARTEEVFVPNLFATTDYTSRGWTKMYRTGDLGYLDSDGTLTLKGRIAGDTEVKLNGVRINLTEIENTVLTAAENILSDAVASLVATSSTENALNLMVVRVVFSETHEVVVDKSGFLKHLLQTLPLPQNMKPAMLIPLEAIPRTLSGKVDRKAVSALQLPASARGMSREDELSPAQAKVAALWRDVISGSHAPLGDFDGSTDFFTVGGTSLLLIELQHKLRRQLGKPVSLFQLFQASTLQAMAQLLYSGETEMEMKRIDWGQETSIPEAVMCEMNISRPPAVLPRTPPRVVVLTGATGFLGQYLVRELASRDHVDKILCIATRNSSSRSDIPNTDSPKVEFYDGDLRLPRLGLDEATSQAIFGVADAVVHNGADVSHLKTYASLRDANVVSTHELLKMCLPRNIPLHYISTTGVSMYTTADTMKPASVRGFPPPTDGLYGYVASKWAGEVFLENISEKTTQSIVIHRPSSIIRPDTDMSGDAPAADVVQNMLLYSERISAVPAGVGSLPGYLDLVQPETVSRKVVEIVADSTLHAQSGVTYVHESGDFEICLAGIREHIAGSIKRSISEVEEISMDEWISRSREVGLSGAMAAVFRAIESGEELNFPQLLH
ncbi:hypothetical protein NLG97_g2739 [Lecanicillium saksenae]|uniref:Uncharacterized protein n=1 Tax=Lecanicillium saksenae TaxID=468837 RepID=A0ACC1R020_9HYPO|nr:hypothetical protein NLG97_g2739 [Lecanicillium saksenae]